eukprot:scaffold486_cov148-Skeletonema_dohrnii-CCMP3373.AAC.22
MATAGEACRFALGLGCVLRICESPRKNHLRTRVTISNLSFPSCFSFSKSLHRSPFIPQNLYMVAASKIAESADVEGALPPAPLILEALEVSRSR